MSRDLAGQGASGYADRTMDAEAFYREHGFDDGAAWVGARRAYVADAAVQPEATPPPPSASPSSR